MLHDLKDLFGRDVYGTDESLGTIEDCYFDDQRWRIRYLLIDAGWFDSKHFLASPSAFSNFTWGKDKKSRLTLPLSRERVRNSPRVGEENLTREQETELNRYYGWSQYWSGTGTASTMSSGATSIGNRKGMGQADPSVLTLDDDSPLTGNYALRSLKKCIGYHLQASDGEIGHVDNFFVDDGNWRLRYAQIDTSNLPGGKTVLLATDWFESIDWDNKKIRVNLTKDAIQNSPEFDPKSLNRDYEEKLYRHYR